MPTFQLSNYEFGVLEVLHTHVYIRECLELLLKLDEVLTLISKLHTDSSIHMYKRMFSKRMSRVR